MQCYPGLFLLGHCGCPQPSYNLMSITNAKVPCEVPQKSQDC